MTHAFSHATQNSSWQSQLVTFSLNGDPAFSKSCISREDLSVCAWQPIHRSQLAITLAAKAPRLYPLFKGGSVLAAATLHQSVGWTWNSKTTSQEHFDLWCVFSDYLCFASKCVLFTHPMPAWTQSDTRAARSGFIFCQGTFTTNALTTAPQYLEKTHRA